MLKENEATFSGLPVKLKRGITVEYFRTSLATPLVTAFSSSSYDITF